MISMLGLRNSADGARQHEGTGSDPVPSCGSGTVRQARLPGASKSPARSPSRNACHSSRSNLSSGPAGSFESRIRTSFGVNETSMHALESQTLLRIHCGLEAPWLPLTFILQYTNRCVRTDSLWHRNAQGRPRPRVTVHPHTMARGAPRAGQFARIRVPGTGRSPRPFNAVRHRARIETGECPTVAVLVAGSRGNRQADRRSASAAPSVGQSGRRSNRDSSSAARAWINRFDAAGSSD